MQAVHAGVVIVDDNERFRAKARRMLEAGGYEVLADVPDGAAALAAVRRHRPAVALVDVQLPDMSGMLVADLLAREPDAPAVVLTSTCDASDFGSLLTSCGARGFLPKAELSAAGIEALVGNGT
jgi:DNA-binding NarL/FixJ family response regulator